MATYLMRGKNFHNYSQFFFHYITQNKIQKSALYWLTLYLDDLWIAIFICYNYFNPKIHFAKHSCLTLEAMYLRLCYQLFTISPQKAGVIIIYDCIVRKKEAFKWIHISSLNESLYQVKYFCLGKFLLPLSAFSNVHSAARQNLIRSHMVNLPR